MDIDKPDVHIPVSELSQTKLCRSRSQIHSRLPFPVNTGLCLFSPQFHRFPKSHKNPGMSGWVHTFNIESLYQVFYSSLTSLPHIRKSRSIFSSVTHMASIITRGVKIRQLCKGFGSCLEIVRPLDHNAVVGPSQRRGLPPIMQSAQEHAAV